MTSSPIFLHKLSNRIIPANTNLHMSIRRSQAILKWSRSLGLRWAQRTNFADLRHLRNFFSGRLPLAVSKTLNNQQSDIFTKIVKSKQWSWERNCKCCANARWFLGINTSPMGWQLISAASTFRGRTRNRTKLTLAHKKHSYKSLLNFGQVHIK